MILVSQNRDLDIFIFMLDIYSFWIWLLVTISNQMWREYFLQMKKVNLIFEGYLLFSHYCIYPVVMGHEVNSTNQMIVSIDFVSGSPRCFMINWN
jgi:hypothetical protein